MGAAKTLGPVDLKQASLQAGFVFKKNATGASYKVDGWSVCLDAQVSISKIKLENKSLDLCVASDFLNFQTPKDVKIFGFKFPSIELVYLRTLNMTWSRLSNLQVKFPKIHFGIPNFKIGSLSNISNPLIRGETSSGQTLIFRTFTSPTLNLPSLTNIVPKFRFRLPSFNISVPNLFDFTFGEVKMSFSKLTQVVRLFKCNLNVSFPTLKWLSLNVNLDIFRFNVSRGFSNGFFNMKGLGSMGNFFGKPWLPKLNLGFFDAQHGEQGKYIYVVFQSVQF